MNDTKQMGMSINKLYKKGESKNSLMALTFVQKIIIAWHKHHYLKYRYLEEGCINKKIRRELQEKKVYHYEKYVEVL